MRVPDTLPSRFCFVLEILPPDIFLGRVTLDVLAFNPSSLQHLVDNWNTTNPRDTKITGDIIVRREGVCAIQGDFFSDGEGAEVFSGFESPRLNLKR